MKRSGASARVLCCLPILVWAVSMAGTARGAVPEELKEAATAVEDGNEARAWQLFSENRAAFDGAWNELDGTFVVWVADQFRKQNRYSEALAICDRVLSKEDRFEPADVATAILVKGDTYADQENFSAARLEYRSIERNAAFDDTEAGRAAIFRIVDVNRRTQDYEAALEIVERMKDRKDLETQAHAYYYNALIAFDQGSYDEAREFIEAAKKRKADHIETLFLEARLNLLEDRLQDPELEIGMRVLATFVIPGRPVTLKMQDRNLAVVRGGASIPVQMQTSAGGDTETVNLLPSPRDATMFRATINSELGEAEPGSTRLEVTGSDIVTYKIEEAFQEANELRYEPKKMLVVSDAELTASSGKFVSAEERDERALARRRAQAEADAETLRAYERLRDTTVVRPGNKVYVQVVDADRDMGSELDAVHVDAVSSSGDSVSGVELVETEPHSGTFQGSLLTGTAPPKATASSTKEGASTRAPLTTRDNGQWTAAGSGGAEWYQVDLMATHPIRTATLDLGPETRVERVVLTGRVGGDMTFLGSTEPSRKAMYGYIDLAAHFEREKPKQTAAYLYTEVDSDAARTVSFKLGSSDGIVCWVNGERVHKNLGGRLWKPEEDVADVNLKAGKNSILLRVSQLSGPWGASLSIVDAQGRGLPGLETPPPLKPGVVTKWHLFDRLTPENIRVSERINVHKPIRIRDEFFAWVPLDVTPTAHLRVEGGALVADFNKTVGERILKWSFAPHSGPLTIRSVGVENEFEETVLPVDRDYDAIAENRTLELGPGDEIEISYTDERRVRTEEMLVATMHASFHNADISLAYDLISRTRSGERKIEYDPALRYRAGETERLVVQVADYDADTSDENDKVRILVGTSKGERLWLDGIETSRHSGVFRAVLRLGSATGGDTIEVGQDVTLRASYSDRENSDGIVARTATVRETPDDPPELMLYRTTVTTLPPSEERRTVEKTSNSELAKRGDARDEPVVTSMDAPVMFKTIYPYAALREGSTISAKVHVEESGDAPLDITMSLSDGENGEFAGAVPIRVGEPSAYTELDAELTEKGKEKQYLYLYGGDVVRVTVASADGQVTREGWFTLATDGTLRFTDRKYEQPEETAHVGDYIYLALDDRDSDASEGFDTVKVMLKTKAGLKTVELSETLPHSGVFTGRVKSEPMGKGDAEGDAEPAVADSAGAEAAAVAPTNDVADVDVVEAAFGDTLIAHYVDASSVAANGEQRNVKAMLRFHLGADGTIAGFTKLFADEDIAVRTRLLTAEALFEMAKDYRATKQEELAEDSLAEGRMILEEAIADYPHTKHAPHAEFLLANLAQELEKYKEALGRYNKVLSAWPDSEFAPKAQLKKGICLEKMKDYDNAMDTYVELTYSYPSSELVSDAVVRLGQHFYRVARYDVAGRVFGRFQESNPEHKLAAKALFLSGQSFLKGFEAQRKLEDPTSRRSGGKADKWLAEATKQFATLVDEYDDDRKLCSEALYWLGECGLKSGDMKGAYLAFKRLTIDYPETKWAKYARGRLVENERAFEGM